MTPLERAVRIGDITFNEAWLKEILRQTVYAAMFKVKYYIIPKDIIVEAYFEPVVGWDEVRTTREVKYRPEEITWMARPEVKDGKSCGYIDLTQYKGWHKGKPTKIRLASDEFVEEFEANV